MKRKITRFSQSLSTIIAVVFPGMMWFLIPPANEISTSAAIPVIVLIHDSIKTIARFPNGGGTVQLVNCDPVTIRVSPHDEGGARWGKVWFHFQVLGLKEGQEITIELEKSEPPIAGIARQVVSSSDGKNYELIQTGAVSADGKLFVYKHTVHAGNAWFAYHFPYTTADIQRLLIPALQKNKQLQFFELTKSRKGRSVNAVDFNPSRSPKKYGIWIQARAHAFESGASWLAHYLTVWFASDDSMAVALRSIAEITVVPIVDMDGVEDGRTGKNTVPYDHGRSWNDKKSHWPEINAIKSLVKQRAGRNGIDLFIDIHGPGGGHHPFFIVPLEKDLPFEKQRNNRAAFFSVLRAKPLEDRAKGEQSMTTFHYSARSLEKFETNKGMPPQWATIALNKHIIAMTLETNMNSPLSTLSGYDEQAAVFGKAIATYFIGNMHKK